MQRFETHHEGGWLVGRGEGADVGRGGRPPLRRGEEGKREVELTWAGPVRSVGQLAMVHDRIADSRRRVTSARRTEPQVGAGTRPEAIVAPRGPRRRGMRDVGSRDQGSGRLKHGCACIRQ